MCLQVMAHHTLACYAVVVATSGAIKKTTSGKVQRRACRAAFERGEYTEVTCLPSCLHITLHDHAAFMAAKLPIRSSWSET